MNSHHVDVQKEFAAHLRDPYENQAPKDIDDDRMEVYRGLVFKNVKNFLDGNFPVLKKLYSVSEWESIARRFLAKHVAHTPYFAQIGNEFLTFLPEQDDLLADKPFIAELAVYEYVELELFIAPEEFPGTGYTTNPDQLNSSGRVTLSPLVRLLAFEYPVHQISESFQPTEKVEQAICLVVHRDRRDKVGFELVPAPTLRFLQIIDEQQDDVTLQSCIEQLAAEMQTQVDLIADNLLELAKDLMQKDILLLAL